MSVTKKLLTATAAVLLLAAAGCKTTPKDNGGGSDGGMADNGGVRDNGVTDESMAPTPGSVQDFVVNVGDRVYFDLDEYVIRPDARPILDGQAEWLNRYRSVRVRLEGNADERGTREYNFALGGRRANAVREYLVARGVDPARIETISYGKERPIDPGSNEEAWARNRNTHTAITGGAR